jgi:integrase
MTLPPNISRLWARRMILLGAIICDDLATVQKIVGHKNVNTTSGYGRRGETEKQIAAKLLHVPFIRMRR